jgi:SnoaL-like domain
MDELITGSIQELLDKQAIREAVLRFCRGVDRCDPHLLASAYHHDAVDEHGARTFAGGEIGPGIVELVRCSRLCIHQVTNQLIELHGPERAASETYFAVWQVLEHNGSERFHQGLGRYIDRFERRNGSWRIAHRLVIVDLNRVVALDEVPSSISGRGRRDRDDPSYAALSGSA